MPRWLAHLAIVVGWLLTPALAWAASYVGFWFGAVIGVRFAHPLAMLGAALLVSGVAGFGALWSWVHFMRRLPHLLSHHMAARASQEQAAVAAAD